MKAGLVIYTASIHQLTGFYAQVFELEVIESDNSYALLTKGDFELVLLETETSRQALDSHEARSNTAIKPVFFIDVPLEQLGDRIKALGGALHPPKNWSFGGRQVCDAQDCEGNIFQLRIKKDS